MQISSSWLSPRRKLTAALALPALVAVQAIVAAGPADFWVRFASQPELTSAARITDWKARGRSVLETLQNKANRDQADAARSLDHAFDAVSNAPRATAGLLTGKVTDSADRPLAGASLGTPDGNTVQTDAEGNYQLYLDEGSHDVTISLFGYDTQVLAGAAVVQPIMLQRLGC